jgi:hypothetical protein
MGNKMKNILKISLLAGGIYFFLVTVAHAINLKIPGLFIYFNVPSYAYQNKIISGLSIGWSVFLFTAFITLSKSVIKSIIIAGAVILIMLIYINCSTDFKSLSSSINVNVFHLETGILFIYWLWLVVWYNKLKNDLNQ